MLNKALRFLKIHKSYFSAFQLKKRHRHSLNEMLKLALKPVFLFMLFWSVLNNGSSQLFGQLRAEQGEGVKNISFYAGNCSADSNSTSTGWHLANSASGRPSIVKGENETYDETNSAVYAGGEGDLICEKFRLANGDNLQKKASSTERVEAAFLATTTSSATSTDSAGEATTSAENKYGTIFDSGSVGAMGQTKDEKQASTSTSTSTEVAAKTEEKSVVPEVLGGYDLLNQLVVIVGEAIKKELSNTAPKVSAADNSVELADDQKLQASKIRLSLSAEEKAALEDAISQTSSSSKLTIWYSLSNNSGLELSASSSGAWSELWQELAILPVGTSTECADIKSDYNCLKETNSAGAYFVFDAPFIKNGLDAKNLRLKISGSAGVSRFETLLDSVWVTSAIDENDNPAEDNGYSAADQAIFDGREINFTHTDDNTNENLIIKTDQASYDGIGGSTVYFSVTNSGTTTENVRLQAHFPNDAGDVGTIERLRVRENTKEQEEMNDGEFSQPNIFQKAFYREYQRKAVPTGMRVKKSTKNTFKLAPGKTQFFKMQISYPVSSSGEFYIEAEGDNEGYGLLDPWWSSTWKFKLPVNVNNAGNPNTLTDYQVLVDISSTTVDFWNYAKTDCSDVRVLDSTETTQLTHWVQYCDRRGTTTQIWVKVPSVPANSSTTIYVYAGNPSTTSVSDMYGTFTYPTLQDLNYVVNSNLTNASITVVSLIDNNQVQLNSGTIINLNRQATTTFLAPTATSVLRALGPVMAKISNATGTDALVPISFAGTQFLFPSILNTESFARYSPWSKATTTIYDALVVGSTGAIGTGTASTTVYNVATAGMVEATAPILAYMWDSGLGDSIVGYPATKRDLYGIRSQNNYIGHGTNGTTYNIYCSGITTVAPVAQNRGARYTNATCASATQGGGNAVRITNISQPIGAINQNDGDGAESEVYLPDIELASEYMVPSNAQYVAIACPPKTGTNTIAYYNAANVLVSTTSCNINTSYPGKAFFGSTTNGVFVGQGSRIVSLGGQPFYAYFEDMTAPGTASSGVESNLWGAVQARKRVAVEPVVTLGVVDYFRTNITGKVYTDEGVTPLLTKPQVSLFYNGTFVASTSASSTDGSYEFLNIKSPTASQTVLAFLASTTVPGARYDRFAGAGNLAAFDLYKNMFVLQSDDGLPITNADIDKYDFDQNNQIQPRVSGGNIMATSSMLHIAPNTSYVSSGTVTLLSAGTSTMAGGSINISSTTSVFNIGANAITLDGNWSNKGDFLKAGGQSVTFVSTSTGFGINNGSSTFANLIFNGAGGGWSFATSTTIDSALTMTAGTLSGTSSVLVKGGAVTGNGTIAMTGGNFMVVGTGNFGGTTGWTFNSLTFGDGVTAGTTTKAGTGQATTTDTLAILNNQALNAGSITWNIVGSGTPFTVAGTFVPQTSTFVYRGATSTIASTTYNILQLAPLVAGNPVYKIMSGTTSVAGNFTVGNGTTQVVAEASTTNATLDVTGNMTISANATYVAATSAPFYLSGNWLNSGTFTENGGKIVFDAPAVGRTIGPGNSNFHDVYFNGTNGAWTLSANATTTGNLTLNAGTFIGTNRTIWIGGLFYNNLINASTTWTGSTLYIYGPSQTTNASTSLGNTYATLRVGSTTQLRMWNSSATTYTIDPGGSLYSMDHAGVNGSLYIWGDYKKSSGQDYWSYATDFDGTNISGTPRQANVRLFTNATTTYNGGTLNIAGQNMTTGSTTIANQGAGTYAMIINGGFINAGNFNVRNIATSGLNILGTSTVLNFSNADLNLQIAGASMMTVSSTTIDNNPQAVFTGLIFATSSGIGSGNNISVIGTSTSYWYMQGATGNRSGEAFDVDSGGACGSMLWDDSVCVTTIDQTHFRWRLDDNSDTLATWSKSEDAILTGQPKNQNLRLRFGLNNTGPQAAFNARYRLQMAPKSLYASCAAVPAVNFVQLATTTGSNPIAVMTTSPYLVNQATTTSQMTPLGSYSIGRVVASSSNESVPIISGINQYTETEYSFAFTNQAINNETYCFRAASSSGSLNSYAQIAAVKIIGINVNGNAYADEAATIWSGCDNLTKNISLVANGVLVGSTTCSNATGAYGFTDVDVATNTPVSVFFNTNGGNIDKGVAVTKAANIFTDIVLNPRKNRVWVKMETGIASIANSDLNHCYAGSSVDCANVPYVTSAGNITVDKTAKLIVGNNSIYQPAGQVVTNFGDTSVNVGGDVLVMSGSTLNMQANALTVGGDYLNQGTFSYAAGQTVTFTATSTGFTINNNNTNFANLVFNGAGGGWMITASTSLDNNLTVSNGTLSGTNNLTVYGPSASGDGTISLAGGNFTLAGGGMIGGASNWTFNNLIIGTGTPATTTKAGAGSIAIASILTIATSSNLNASTSVWNLSGSGNPLLINGTLNTASTTIRFTGNGATNINAINYYRLELAPGSAGSPLYTLGSGAILVRDYLYIGDGTNPVTVTVAANNTNLNVYGDLNIKNAGTLTASPSVNLNIGGSWLNTGSFIHNTGTVVFTASSTGKTISAGTSPFYKVAFNNVLGGWTMNQNATTTNNFSLATGTQFTLASNTTLEVQGLFIDNLNKASTTWAGSTLLINGTSQVLNAKTDSGANFGTLQLGNNTKVKIWNSSVATATVPASSYLYSMDNNSVDGSLYIWGNYLATTSAEYWSYSTDFDGTDLTATPRAADVRIASGSVVSISTTTLMLVGTSTATTTIANQGAGTFDLNISSSTLNADYFQLRNTGAKGLNISASSTVVSLSHGDLLLEYNGGALITLSPVVMNKTGTKAWPTMKFASSTGIVSAYNVNLTGTPSVTWDFSGSTGNLAGENFDGDPGDPRGYLLWDDSPDWLPKSQNWRWYFDQNLETPTSTAAAENVAPSNIANGNALKLRLTVKETNNLIGNNVKLRLQYSTASDFSSNVRDVGEIGSSSPWTYANGVDADNDPITKILLSDALATSTHNKSGTSTSNYVLLPGSSAEWEFTVLANGAATGTVYYFRAYANQPKIGPVLVNISKSYPSLMISQNAMNATLSGYNTGTVVSGVTIAATSTPSTMPFGTLAFGVDVVGAQQISVSTNAEFGYQLFVKESQSFKNAAGAVMTDVPGDNANPLAWPVSNVSAFGYHTSDPTLSGVNPSRFANDNTYAKFEPTMREVGYSAVPVANDVTSIVYRLKAASQQGAGDYQNSIEYILVPTY